VSAGRRRPAAGSSARTRVTYIRDVSAHVSSSGSARRRPPTTRTGPTALQWRLTTFAT
jgi:hypothetical protein